MTLLRPGCSSARSRVASLHPFILLLMVILSAGLLHAQVTTGDVLGTVRDPGGAVIPNATITLTDTGTQQTHTMHSNASGEYVFSLLQQGTYTVDAKAPGFQPVEVRNIVLSAGQRVRADAVLKLGQNTQTVQVTAAPPNLDTDSSSLSTTIPNNQVEDLPLNGRNFVQLAQLAAGANEGTSSAISNGNRPDDRRQTSAISVDAQSDTLNNELVDGMDNNEHVIGTIGVRPSIDAIAQVQVLTNLYPAEAGNTPGAVVNVITRAGQNAFHGSAYEFVRNDMFDARDFFASVGRKPEYRQNQFGGSLGGPIRRNKTFFFGDYEGYRIVQGTTTVSTVPTLFEEQNPGNLSDIGGPVLTPAQLNPIALQYLSLYPAPNLAGTVNNFTYSPNNVQTSNTWDARIDHQFSSHDSFFGRYTYNSVTTDTASGLPTVNGVAPGGSVSYPGVADDTAQQAILNYVHIFSPTLALDLRAGYTRIDNTSLPLNYGQNEGTKFGIVNSNLNQLTSALPNVYVSGYAELGDSEYLPLINLDNTFQYQGSLTQTKGRHTLKYGATLIRRQVEEAQNGQGPGAFVFITSPSKYALANFLSGTPYSVARTLQLDTPNLRTWQVAGYAQDDWRARSWLTLNLGVRYDLDTPDTEAHGYISNFDPATASLIVPGQNGASATAGVNTDYRAIAPRIGFAANVRPGTVARGGFGMVYFRDDTAPDLPFGNQPYAYTYAPAPFTATMSTPFPLPAQQSTTNLSGGIIAMAKNYRDSYVEQFNLNVEQDIGHGTVFNAGYVGELGRQLRITPNIDLASPALNQPGCTADCFLTRMPYYTRLPNINYIYMIQTGGYQNYNSLQTTMRQRFAGGVSGIATYTWSHAIGDTVGFSEGGLYTSAVPSQTATLERGNSDLDMRDRFSLLLNYALPFGHSLTGYKAVLGKGWQFNAIDVWETGTPFSVSNASPLSNTGIGSDRPDQIAPVTVRNPSIHEWFNTAAFAPQAFGTIGTERRDAVYGPHYRHFDASIFKDFALSERFTLQARAESFNLTNTPNFDLPQATLGVPGFGTISSTRVGSTPRELQFAMRLSF